MLLASGANDSHQTTGYDTDALIAGHRTYALVPARSQFSCLSASYHVKQRFFARIQDILSAAPFSIFPGGDALLWGGRLKRVTKPHHRLIRYLCAVINMPAAPISGLYWVEFIRSDNDLLRTSAVCFARPRAGGPFGRRASAQQRVLAVISD
uniref:Transposase n=1 Tax=Steinernema glaseri TaxID=37863 RepID=A0A1I7ZXG2_9BILA